MPQSLSNILLHVVFSTKNRATFLKSRDLRGDLTGYMVTTLRNIECPSLSLGIVEDHLHCLCQLSRKISVADLIKEMKTHSSAWIKSQSKDLRDFCWQAGYGAFSVSQSNVQSLMKYIASQEKRHLRMTFQDEFRILCDRHEVEFDERYVWD